MKKLFDFVYIYCLLVKLDVLLKSKGFPTVFKMYARKYEPIKNINYEIDKVEEVNLKIKKLIILVELVCSYYPGNAKCIHRSFLTYRILRQRYKIPLRLVIGVSQFPFGAHAWVMQGQYNVADDNIHTNNYKIILDSYAYLKGGQRE